MGNPSGVCGGYCLLDFKSGFWGSFVSLVIWGPFWGSGTVFEIYVSSKNSNNTHVSWTD